MNRKPRDPDAYFDRWFGGKEENLLDFVCHCFLNNWGVPRRAQEMFMRAVLKGRSYEFKSWDDVFRPPINKGQQLDALRRSARSSWEIWELVRKRNRAGEPIGKKMFAAIGREMGIGGATTVEKIYYLEKSQRRPLRRGSQEDR